MSEAGGADACPGLPAGWRLEIAEALPSTSDALRRLAEDGAPAKLALMARRQTAGRGRAGRVWASPQGNLHLSLLLRPCAPADSVGLWALLAGVALADSVRAQDPQPGLLRLKWPNDLLRGGGKVAGILAEAALRPNGSRQLAWLILGFGANIAAAPDLGDRPTATLAVREPPETLAARLLNRMEHWTAVAAAQGFAPVRAAWGALGPSQGEPAAVRLGDTMVAGRFAGLAEDGGLLLDTAAGRRHILSGEVLAPAAEGAGGG